MSVAGGEDFFRGRRTHVSKYRLLAEIGNGGMADVYLAVAEGPAGFNKLVVLKVLRPTYAKHIKFRQMFLEEARLAARLNHPNVVQSYEVGEHAGDYFLAMEYLEGQPLSRILERAERGAKLPLALHLRMLSEALGGLHYAHELTDYDGEPLHLVHRDVTPQNLFVTYAGQIKLLDFGIAKTAQSSVQTETGGLRGKIGYMAPEQIASEDTNLDRRADIYSMGVMLWEAAARRKLWDGLSETAILNRVMNGEVPSPRELNPDVPDALERVCMKALSVERDARHSTALELQADVETVIESLAGKVTARDAGRLVAELFSDARVRMRGIVDSQLRASNSLSYLTAADLGGAIRDSETTPARGINAGDLGMTMGDGVLSGPNQAGLTESLVRPSSARRRPLVIGLVVALAATTVFLATTYLKGQNEATKVAPVATGAPSATVSAAPSASAPVEPATQIVSMRVKASPPEAHGTLDGVSIASFPYAGRYARDTNAHELRVEADGYAPQVKTINFDKDVDLSITLEKVAKTPAKPTPVIRQTNKGGKTPHVTATPSATASTPPTGTSKPVRTLDTDVFGGSKP